MPESAPAEDNIPAGFPPNPYLEKKVSTGSADGWEEVKKDEVTAEDT